ncbi:MAG: GntR family transcriptional regulator [Acidimicrobiia bacterium]|nr:GntR family transcriptional regulator [Acidimicrobiia bacterium]
MVRIDPAGPASPGEQLVTQVAASISSGELAPGERLPTIRSLAADLGLAPGTVARAYAELERDGWVHTQGRRGTVVAARTPTPSEREVAAAAQALAALADAAGLASADAHRALDVAFARLAREM